MCLIHMCLHDCLQLTALRNFWDFLFPLWAWKLSGLQYKNHKLKSKTFYKFYIKMLKNRPVRALKISKQFLIISF